MLHLSVFGGGALLALACATTLLVIVCRRVSKKSKVQTKSLPLERGVSLKRARSGTNVNLSNRARVASFTGPTPGYDALQEDGVSAKQGHGAIVSSEI